MITLRPSGTRLLFVVILAVLVGCSDSGSGWATLSEADAGRDNSYGVSVDGTSRANPIRLDQFGYRPSDPKVALIADARVGFDAPTDFEAGTTFEVRRSGTLEVVFTGAPDMWADGAVHEQSGDRGWWFDFSGVNAPGDYYVYDLDNDIASDPFVIGDDVYDDVLDAALRMFWYNRANTAHPDNLAGPWADAAAYAGQEQDGEARSIDDPSNPDTALDLSGGWFDAGDPNKYVTFASEPVHLLLTAYERHPGVFDDEVGIPESGNDIPDVIDEIKWEVDWLERMQMPDGGVLTKVGITEWEWQGLPSESPYPRFYEEACSSSTIAAAAMFAHAALVFRTIPELADDADRLQLRAQDAWEWFHARPTRDDCDPQIIKAGDADETFEEQARDEVTAAIYLLALTGDSSFHDVIEDKLDDTGLFIGDQFGMYSPDQSDALLLYRTLPNAQGAVSDSIDARLDTLADNSSTFGFDPAASLYRSFMPDEQYHWGSNRVMANIGIANLTIGEGEGPAVRALDHLHYFHGVNPLGLVYLSNMEKFGAERSVEELFHFWMDNVDFVTADGSDAGVAPGFVVGGPDRDYSGASPPGNQPPLKSYRDWPGDGNEPVWEISEPAIYYQASYVRLLAEVLGMDTL